MLGIKIRERNKRYEGIVRLRQLPEDWTEDDFRYWWLPERNSNGVEVHKPRMSQREKERYQVAEHKNCLTIGGKAILLAFMSVASGAQPFGAYFAVGSGYSSGVSPNDTSLNTEFYRSLTTGYSIQGNQTDIATYFSSGSGVGNWTNSGLYGGAATATLNSGTLCTKTLFSWVKNSTPVTCDYLITQA